MRGEVDDIGTEERWRLWIAMLESDEDASEWLKGIFLAPGFATAKEGMRDPAMLGFSLLDVGRTNIEEVNELVSTKESLLTSVW